MERRNVCHGIAGLCKSDFTVSLYKHVSRYHGEPEKQILQQISSRVKMKCDAFIFQRKNKGDTHRVNPRPLHDSSDIIFDRFLKNSFLYYRDGVYSTVWVLVLDLLPNENGSCYYSICICCVVTYYLVWILCDVNQSVSSIITLYVCFFLMLFNLDHCVCMCLHSS